MAIDPNNPFADLPDTQNDPFADLPDAQQSESGIMPALGAGIDKMQELGYRAVKGFTDVGVPQEEQTNALGRAIGQGGALSRWADEGIARNIEEQKAYTPSVASYKDIDSIGDAASYVGEMTAQSVPMMATALSPAGLFAMGGGLSNEAYEAQPEDNKQPWRATASGFGQAGLERLGVETAIGRVFGGEGKQFAKRVGQSMLGEGTTETGQEALAQWGSGKSLDEIENLDEAFVGGALVGGTIRTGTEAGKAAYDKYRGERPELSDIEETDLTQSASSAESVIPDPFADIGPAQDQTVTGNEIEIIPGETAGDSQPNWQFGQNDMPYRGEVTPYVYDGEYEQYRETPNSVPVGAALEAPIIDGEFERPRGLPNRADTIIGEDGRPMQQAQEFADYVGQASNRALPFDDVVYAEDKRNVQVKRNGQPFGGRRAAELTKEFRQAKEQGLNPQVIKVNGGYGWVSEGDNVGLDTGSVEQSSDLQVGGAGVALPRDVRGDNGGRLRESADGTTGTGDAENIALAARRDTNDDALGAEAEGIPTNEGLAYPSEEAQAMPKWKERQARIDSIAKDYVGKLQGETASEQVAQIMSDGHSEIDAQHIATSANMMEMAATSETTSALDQAANEAATSPTNDRPEPTEAQKEAGNYKKGKVRLHGLDISIENPKGSTRKGKDQDGKEWSSEMKHHYGDIKGTTGADGDSIDVFIGDNPESQKVFVVDQVDPKTGNFDEVKVMMGFDDAETAKSGYLSNYDKDWKGLGEITEASVEDFKAWTKRPRKSKQPFALPAKPKSEEVAVKDQEDWGEKITTARKNISVRWNENSTDDEISSKPLSKTWPEKEFDDVGDTYASAFAFAARGEIPRKPNQPYKKQGWVEKVKSYRQLVKDNVVDGLLTGKITKEKLKELGGKRNLQDFFAKVDLLSELDRKDWGKVERVLSYPDSMDFNPKTDKLDIPNPKTYVRINGRNREFNSTDPKVLAEQIKPFLEEKVEKPQMKFEVRGRKGSYFVNKKGDPEYTRLATFDSSKEAFDFIKNNNSKLVESWESHKARVNVTKADIRNKVNKPRTGEDYRNGKNATAEDFQNTFGIKRGTFGKWVKQGKERQDMLNGTYDALMDLANITGVPPRALSLEGKLGFAFGANGRGKAMAHYEPGEVVINLTKTKGAGSLAHEWFHALDNYFQKKRDTLPTTEKGNFITHNPETYYIGPRGYSVPESRFRDMRGINKNEWRRVEGVRPEVAVSFKNLVDTLNGLDFAKRSSRLDKGKAGGYWSSNLEMAARAFESYVKAKMSANGYDNDFLANVTSVTDFVRDDSRYPYIKADEIAEVEAAFDDLFNTIESKENDSGDVALFRQGDGPKKAKVKVDGKLFETGKPVTFPYLHNRDSATKMFGIPDKDSPFGRGYEPSAKYVTYHDGDKPSYGNFEAGEITFNNPLVIDNDNLNWKQALSESYGGKTGKVLSKAIIKDGFDGIVTVDGKSISEIVDLTTFDEGKALFSAAGTVTGNTNTRTVSRSNANEIVSRFVKGLTSAGKNYVSVVSSYDDLPTEIKDAAKAQGVEYQVKGVFHKGKVHVVLDQHTSALDMETTLFHEAYGHLGIKNLFGDDITKKLNSLFIANGGLQGLRETAKRHGINLEKYIKGLDKTNMPQEMKNRVLMDELLAHLQQSNKPSVKRLAREIVGMIREGLRKLGLPGLSKVTDSDLFYILKKARDAAKKGDTQNGDARFMFDDKGASVDSDMSSEPTSFRVGEEGNQSENKLMESAKQKLGLKENEAKSIVSKVKEAWKDVNYTDAKNRVKEGLFDSLYGIKKAEDAQNVSLEKSGYVSARLAQGVGDVIHATMFYGSPEWRDGIVQKKEGTKGLLDIFSQLDSSELNDWLAWMGGNRANVLMKQGRENNLNKSEIEELQSLNSGREELFNKVKEEYNAANAAVLKLAIESGLLDSDVMNKFESEWYVPFFRAEDPTDINEVIKGPTSPNGIANASAQIKTLKGGEQSTKDILQNILQRQATLIDASMKNKAMLEVAGNLDGTPFMKKVKLNKIQIDAITKKRLAKKATPYVSVNENGETQWYEVLEPSLLRALMQLNVKRSDNPLMKLSRAAKRYLTTGVTLSPTFIIRNYLRDGVHGWMINKDKFVFGLDSVKGAVKTWKKDQSTIDLMFAGASFQGGYVHANDPEQGAQQIRRALRKKGLSESAISKYMASIPKGAGQFFEKYRDFSDSMENANRVSTYDASLKANKSKKQSAFEARDFMDFGLQGNFSAMQFLTDVIPFLNARMQGLYKLYRSGKAGEGESFAKVLSKELAIKGMYVASFSLALALYNMDDERYEELPDWDKDANWHFFNGETHIRIPKPFELGVIFGTVPERLFMRTMGKQNNKDLERSMTHAVTSTLAMNPFPQIIKPGFEVWANYDFFSGRPIDSFSDQFKRPQDRYSMYTTESAKAIGDALGVSPQRVEHLVRGYAGTLGSYVLTSADIIGNSFATATGKGEFKINEFDDLSLIRAFVKTGEVGGTYYGEQFYDTLQEINSLHKQYVNANQEQDEEAAEEILEEGLSKLQFRSMFNKAQAHLNKLNHQKNIIWKDKSISLKEREKIIDDISREKNAVYRSVILEYRKAN